MLSFSPDKVTPLPSKQIPDKTEVTFRPVERNEMPAIRPKLSLFRARLVEMQPDAPGRYAGSIEVGTQDAPQTISLVLEGVASPILHVGSETVTLKSSVPGASSEVAEFSGSITFPVKIENEKEVMTLSVTWFGVNHPRRASGNAPLYYNLETFTGGNVVLKGKTYRAALFDTNYRGDFRGKVTSPVTGVLLLLDANGNGSFDVRGEAFDTGQPFNIGGTTYEISGMNAEGRHFTVKKSAKSVPEITPPPDLREGNSAPPFKATSIGGKQISFPKDYAGKLVMLIFWASWCGDCQREVPYFTSAYAKLHLQGLEALGISLDRSNTLTDLKSYLKKSKMEWAQIYSGGFWEDKTVYLYGIDWIPTFLLVDGDTGKIVASGESLSPSKMEATLRAALETKSKSPKAPSQK